MPPGSQPFIYNPPRRYTAHDPYGGFDPKAVTRASYIPPAPRRRPDGPLIDFNRHPDSWGGAPYGQTHARPMPESTKHVIKWMRRVQLGFRSLQLFTSLGMLACVICVKNTDITSAYIIRVPPAIDILSTGYGVYHLMRGPNGRPAGSSASYHFFSLVMDAGLIPFYVFTCLLARKQYMEDDNPDRWMSFFDLAGTDKLLLSTYLIAVILGALHTITIIIAFYLAYIFRKISNLPPDMNPLEDNLTTRSSRNQNKHKYKNSDISGSDISEPVSNSTDSVYKSGRSSPLKNMATVNAQPVTFINTRRDTEKLYSPHNPNTARSAMREKSRYTIHEPPQSVHALSMTSFQDAFSLKGRTPNPERDLAEEDPSTARTMTTTSSVYSDDYDDRRYNSTPPLPRKSSKRQSLLSDNWFVHRYNDNENVDPNFSIVEEEDDEREREEPLIPSDRSANAFKFRPLQSDASRPYQPVSQKPDLTEYADLPNRPFPPPKDDGFVLSPLGMNPPTPPLSLHGDRGTDSRDSPRPLRRTSGNESKPQTPTAGTPTKSRLYGDLSSAVSGIRKSPIPANGSPNSGKRGSKHDFDDGVRRQDWAIGGKKMDGKGRVISRSGADITEEKRYPAVEPEQDGMLGVASLRVRNVSGKIAEEGRGGHWAVQPIR